MYNKMIVSYDTTAYDFASLLQTAYNMDLQKVHTLSNNSGLADKWHIHSLFYSSPQKDQFMSLYSSFVQNVIVPTYTDESAVYVQTEPQIQLSLPGSTALEKRATDFDDLVGVHIDSVIGQRVLNTGDNYLLALTDMFGTNTIFVEEDGQFRGIDINVGQYYTFQGKTIRHANKVNATGLTRISIDFRVIRGSQRGDADVDLSFSTKYDVPKIL